MRKENKATIIFVLFILLIAMFAQFYVTKTKNGSKNVVLTINDEKVFSIYLPDADDQTIELQQYGVNGTVVIKDHKIAFKNVDCPDKLCEKQGFLHNSNDIAVCMPNKMVLKVQ